MRAPLCPVPLNETLSQKISNAGGLQRGQERACWLSLGSGGCPEVRLGSSVAQLVECLPGMPKALGLIPNSEHKSDILVHTYNPSSYKVQAGGLEVQSHPP